MPELDKPPVRLHSGHQEASNSPYRSARLTYRSVDPAAHEGLFTAIYADTAALRSSDPRLERPPQGQSHQGLMCAVADALLGVIICLPSLGPSPELASSSASSSRDTCYEAIGYLHLEPSKPEVAHHRHTTLAIAIVSEHQGKGYGTEAISWALKWAFETAGLHRVGIQVLGDNPRARRLYERVGFRLEGIWREMYWRDGRWWDDIQLGILDREWKEMKHGTLELSGTRVWIGE